MKIIFTVLIIICASVTVSTAKAEGLSLRSHEATYVMKQIRQYGRDWSPIKGAEGVLRYKFSQTCDAWMVEHHTAMHMDYENNQQAQMTWNYTSWEAKDGSKLRFRSQSKRNGVLVEKYNGEARKEADKTVAVYGEPNGRRLTMPKDTFFPTAHLLKIIGQAVQGEALFNASYFDGSGAKADFDVASVSTPHKGEPLKAVKGLDLVVGPVWNIELAFFDPNNQSSQPNMEISARYRKDGISTLLKHDFGDFVLEGRLVDLKYLGDPVCN